MRILLVEDERRTAQLLREFILKLNPTHEILAICDSIEDTVWVLKGESHPPDLIFMDIELSDGLSFEIFKQAVVPCPVIFCTAHDHYALQAFRNHGIAYLLKPFSEKDIREAFEQHQRLQAFFNQSPAQVQSAIAEITPPATTQDQFLVRFRDKMIPVQVADIVAFIRQEEFVLLYHIDGRSFTVTQSLDDMGVVLPPSDFFRINRRAIVQRKWVKEISNSPNRKIALSMAIALPGPLVVSRLKVSGFLKWMERTEG